MLQSANVSNASKNAAKEGGKSATSAADIPTPKAAEPKSARLESGKNPGKTVSGKEAVKTQAEREKVAAREREEKEKENARKAADAKVV